MSEEDDLKKIEKISKEIKKFPDSYQLFIDRAECYCNIEDYQNAIDDYSSSLDLLDENDEGQKSRILFDRGDSYILMRKYKDGVSDLSEVIELGHPDLALAHNIRGLAFRSMRQHDESVEDFTIAISLSTNRSNIATYYLNRALGYKALKETSKSMEDFRSAISNYSKKSDKIDSCKKMFWVIGEFRKMNKQGSFVEDELFYLDCMIKWGPKNGRKKLLLKKISLKQENEMNEEVVSDVTKVLNDFYDKLSVADRIYVYLARAKANEGLSKFDSSLEDIDEILESKYEDVLSCFREVKVLALKSDILSKLGRKGDAIQPLNDAIDLYEKQGFNFDEKIAHHYRTKRGDLYFELGNYEESVNDYSYYFSKCVRDNDPTNRSSFDRSLALLASELKKKKELVHQRRALEILYENYLEGKSYYKEDWIVCEICDCRYLCREYEEAVQECNKGIEKFPRRGFLYFVRGASYFFLGNYESAIVDLKKLYCELHDRYLYELTDFGRNNLLGYLSHSLRLTNDLPQAFYFYHKMKDKGEYMRIRSVEGFGVPNEYFTQELEGGYQIPQGLSSLRKKKYTEFIFTHIEYYEVKDHKTAYQSIVRNLVGEKDENVRNLFKQMLDREFQTNSKDYNERLDFIIEKKLLENDDVFTIQWENGRSYDVNEYLMFSQERYEDEEVILSEDIPFIEQKRLFQYLLGLDKAIGIPEDEFVKDIFPLIEIIKKLKMEQHMFVLCHYIKNLSLRNQIVLFCKLILQQKQKNNDEECSEEEQKRLFPGDYSGTFLESLVDGKDEQLEDEEENCDIEKEFASPLTFSLFKEIQTKISDVEKNLNFVLTLDRMSFFMKLKNMKIEKAISCHPFFSCKSELKEDLITFQSVFEKCVLGDLFGNHSYWDVMLDPSSAFFGSLRLQKGLLCLRSSFFYRMFKFPGIEANSDRVKIDLSYETLVTILMRIYVEPRTLSTYEPRFYERKGMELSLPCLFSLLVHSVMYEDLLLQSDVLVKICEKIDKFEKRDDFILKMLEIGNFVEDLLMSERSEWIHEFLMDHWKEEFKIEKDTVIQLIKYSAKVEEMSKMNKKMSRKNKEMSKKNKEMSKKNKENEKKIEKMEDENEELKKKVEEFESRKRGRNNDAGKGQRKKKRRKK